MQPTVFHPLAYSFFSADLYREVARNWRGRSFLYLLILLTLCWIPGVIWGYSALAGFVEEDAPGIVEQIPRITISDGEVSTDADEPHYIVEPDSGQTLAIIDTTGQVASLEGTDAFVLLTRDRVFLRQNDNETRVYDLSEVQAFSIDRDTIYGWLGSISAWGPIIAFPFLVLGAYVYRIVQALIYAVVGLLLNSLAGTSLDYPAILAVAMVAVTPAVVLKTLIGVVGLEVPFAWLLYFAVAMGYLYFGMRAAGAPAEPEAAAGGPDTPTLDSTDATYPSNGREADGRRRW